MRVEQEERTHGAALEGLRSPLPELPAIYDLSSPFLDSAAYSQQKKEGELEGAEQGCIADNYPIGMDLIQLPEEGENHNQIIGSTLHCRYRVLEVLGKGNFATTYLAEDLTAGPEPEPEPPDIHEVEIISNQSMRRTCALVAVKRLNGAWLNAVGQAEYEILHSLFVNQPPRHIIKPVSAFFDEQNLFHLVLETLDSAKPVSLPERCVCRPPYTQRCRSMLVCPDRHYLFQKLIVQLLSGVQELHKHGLMHADLTPANVLYLPESNRIKIIDLGNVIKVNDPPVSGDAEFEVQSALYRAPEILLGAGPLERKIDVWGAGMVALEWLLGSQGREELEKELQLVWEVIVTGLDTVRQPVMAVSMPTRQALVTRMVRLFGSVDSYQHGVFWKEEYAELASPIRTEVDEFGLGLNEYRVGVLPMFLLNKTLSPGLTEFMASMLQVDVWQRKTTADVLRDPWLLKGLLGEWASVIVDNQFPGGGGQTIGDFMCEVPVGSTANSEDIWVEGVDDSGFAESVEPADGKQTEKGEEDKGASSPIKVYERQKSSTPWWAPEDYTKAGSAREERISDTPSGPHEVAEALTHGPGSPPPHCPRDLNNFDDLPPDGAPPFTSSTDSPSIYTQPYMSPSPYLPYSFPLPSEILQQGENNATSLDKVSTLTMTHITEQGGEIRDIAPALSTNSCRRTSVSSVANISPSILHIKKPPPQDHLKNSPDPESNHDPHITPEDPDDRNLTLTLVDEGEVEENSFNVWHMDLIIEAKVFHSNLVISVCSESH